MSEDQDQEKSHEPTEQQRKKFREKGQLPKSKELVAAASLLAAVAAVSLVPSMLDDMASLMRDVFLDTPDDLDMGAARTLMRRTVWGVATLSLPPLLVVMSGTLIAAVAQGRGIIPKDALEPKWDRIDPVANFKQRFMSITPLVELAKGVIVLGAVLAVAWFDRDAFIGIVLGSLGADGMEQMELMAGLLVRVLLIMAPVALVVGAADYANAWYKLEQKMRMTHKQVRDEHKNTDGDPLVKQARRALQRKLMAAANIAAVKTADVVITNPTHYAVALRYRKGEAPAPVVISRGVDHLALRIKAEAKRHNVPIVENRPLARALYAQTEAGKMIPDDLYAPVAEVLAVILKRRRWRKDS